MSPESAAMLAWTGDERPSARSRASGSHQFASAKMKVAFVAVEEMRESGDWEGATPKHFVALNEALYEEVYGIAVGEVSTRERQLACFAAAKVLAELGDDRAEMAAYMRWAWDREAEREVWRRANGRDGGSLGWRLVFGKVIADYRLAMLRKKAVK